MNDSAADSLARRQTDPLWIQHHFLATGHDETTPNATATFVKRRGRHYMVTCGHVVQIVRRRRDEDGERQLTMALHVNRGVLNLSSVGAEGIVLSVRTPGAELHSRPADVALASLEPSYWEILSSRKSKTAIDLDSWQAPDWSAVRKCLAVGYENEGKTTIQSEGSEMVATRLLNVVADVCSMPVDDTTGFELMSELDRAHGYAFSGMSGGAVYAIEGSNRTEVEDDELFPVGIVYEGCPSTHRAREPDVEDVGRPIFSERDVFIRALMLTPGIFDDWLERVRDVMAADGSE